MRFVVFMYLVKVVVNIHYYKLLFINYMNYSVHYSDYKIMVVCVNCSNSIATVADGICS